MNDPATPSSREARSDPMKTVISVTTPTPIISAVAAPAVRAGLRDALSRASVPGTPRSRATDPPSLSLIHIPD
ncbi:hypothetical protein HUX53_27250, partial [Actinomadura sp. BRA 177]|nr:hypothetical protein [Actinomadura sp. BRA 177]